MIDEAYDFQRKIMRDSDDLNWRWKPDGCDLPWYVASPVLSPPLSRLIQVIVNSDSNYSHFRTKYSQPFLTQTKACFLKQYWSNWRHPQYNAIRFLMTILASCWEQDTNNSFGAMYAAILFLGATNAATVQPLSPLSVLFSTVKKWPWKLCTTRYNGSLRADHLLNNWI
ncbi:unnamed protein product [Brassica oleracea]